ncbi:signal peptide-containing protein [Cryptosporidium canis]|uniref:Signal peptide-containing protein n=1 Tax=Cryptosporidium canis TaxID=195482 RepID=A0A9D5DGE4_9CRYT|nr:signal peptide-containing protein [Cryptosporidium canis]
MIRIPLLLVFCLCVCQLGKLHADVIYAVNCGGPRHFSKSENVLYEEDQGYNGGISTDSGKQLSPFPYVEDDFVFQSERYSTEKTLQYMLKLDKLTPGKFTIVLKFSEIHFKEAGRKVFSIAVGNVLFKQSFDIYKEVGFGVPMEEYIECEFDGENITLNGMNITQGYSKEERILILAMFKQEDNPKINAIVVYKGGQDEIPKLQRPKQKISTESILQRINKEGQVPDISNNYIYIVDEPVFVVKELTVIDSIYNLVSTVPGMAILAIISFATLRMGVILSSRLRD